ncbi:hypothetical protein SDC9_158564 [bioreactor metagenome]|uniref:Uncharacterized protein n=1 Tax=bioreactor metagenome TaxID=1076179 RepID=A0A645FFX1_9ZZZZ
MVDITGERSRFLEYYIHRLEGIGLEHIAGGYLKEVFYRAQVLLCKDFLDEMGYQIGRKALVDGKYETDLFGELELLVLHQMRYHQDLAVPEFGGKTLCDVVAVACS